MSTEEYTDHAIFESLPPGLQGDLKAFGPLENKRSAEIRRFMLDMRGKYDIPPWHAFTLMMKRAALATGESGHLTSENSWYRLKQNDADYLLGAIPPRESWCYLTIRDGDSDRVIEVAVEPKVGRIWSLASETMVAGRMLRYSKKYGDIKRIVSTGVAFKAANKLLRAGKFSGEWVHNPGKPRGAAAKRAQAAAVEEMQKAAPVAERIQTVEYAKPPVPRATLNTELFVPMFEMACMKAHELGLDATVAVWKTKLEPLLKQE